MPTYDFEKRKVSRGFSLSNFQLIQDEREKQKIAVCQETNNEPVFKALGPSSQESFVLPDISMLDKDVANIIKNDLISKSTLLLLRHFLHYNKITVFALNGSKVPTFGFALNILL